MSSVRSCPVRSPQLGDGLVEVVDGTERLVHACEAQVGDLVELAQRTQDGEPDLVAGHLSGTGRPDRLFDGLRQLSQRVLVDRPALARDRKSTRLNSSHGSISYAVFCLKKK